MKTTHHILGEQVERAEALVENYRQLLLLVGRIKAGEVDPANVVIDMAQLRWTQIEYKIEEPPAVPGNADSNHQPAAPLGGGSTVR